MPVSNIPSSRGRNARENLEAMVALARDDATAFGSGLDFDAPVWDVSGAQTVRASSAHQRIRLYFTTHDGGENPSMEGRTPLDGDFATFLKAAVRLREEGGHVSGQIHGTTIRAGRYLHDAMASCGRDPCSMLPEHFLAAAAACKAREEPSSAYRVGRALAGIADTVNRYNVARVRIDFANPFPRVSYDDTRIGKEAEERRKDRIVPAAALDALADIANLVKEPADILRMRCIELLACGGWRINEILTVRAECEVSEAASEDGRPVLDAAGNQVFRYGIAYNAEKGGGHRIKWIPSEMVGIAKRAVADIRRVTQPSRDVLAWMADNPDRARLPDGWHEGVAAAYSMPDVAAMFGIANPTAAAAFLVALGIAGQRTGDAVTRRDLEAGLLASQDARGVPLPADPDRFLFVMPRNWCHRGRATVTSIVEHVFDQQVANFITGRTGVMAVFARFGFANPDGSLLEVTTHQFRHWLNTLQQRGGMSQMEIARWSGRKDMGQNAAYDHRSGVEMAAAAREMMAAGKVRGGPAATHDALRPLTATRSGKPCSPLPTRPTSGCAPTTTPWCPARSTAAAPDAASTWSSRATRPSGRGRRSSWPRRMPCCRTPRRRRKKGLTVRRTTWRTSGVPATRCSACWPSMPTRPCRTAT